MVRKNDPLGPRTTPSCAVCGKGPTVKSHLRPRALHHDLRGDQKAVIFSEVEKPGYQLSQGGRYDKTILCAEHEAALGPYDDYAVDFVRTFPTLRRRVGRVAYEVSPINSELLIRYVSSVVWRHGVSTVCPEVALGPYEKLLRDITFEGAPCLPEPSVLIAFNELPDGSTEPTHQIGMSPSPTTLFERRCWSFWDGGLNFIIKTDRRPFDQRFAQIPLSGDGIGRVLINQMGRSATWQHIERARQNIRARRR